MVSVASLLNPLPSPSLDDETEPHLYHHHHRQPRPAPTTPSPSRHFTTINYLPPPHLRHMPTPSPSASSPALTASSPPTTSSPYHRSAPPRSNPTSSPSSTVAARTKGPINYPPQEDLSLFSSDLLRELRRWNVQPLVGGQQRISQNPRHIPYNSEKKAFWEKTGRESFEVFQYTFSLPNTPSASSGAGEGGEEVERDADSKPYTVMWDYNVGLVRITSFFKCCGYSKVGPPLIPSLRTAPTMLSLVHVDHPSEDAQCQPRAAGYLSQHHGRGTCRSR